MRSLQYVGLSLVLLSAAVCRAEQTPPQIFCCEGADMLAAKTAVQNGSDPAMKKFVAKAIKDADKLVEMKPPSVMDKAFTPPSGDKHDYASLSPYWWPDASKPGGLPYIRRDGEYNPERSKYDLDPAHFTLEGGLAGWRSSVHVLAGRATLLAVKDFRWIDVNGPADGPQERRWVPVGTGNVPFTEVMKILDAAGFDGPVSIHAEYQGRWSWRELDAAAVLAQAVADRAAFHAYIPRVAEIALTARDAKIE